MVHPCSSPYEVQERGWFLKRQVQEMLISSIGEGQRMAVQRACKWLETQVWGVGLYSYHFVSL